MLTLWRNPDNALAAIGEEMDRLVSGLTRDAGTWSYGLAPAADIFETEAAYRVQLDLPGIDPKAIQLRVEKDTLSIQVDRKQPAAVAGETLHRSERAYGTFFRSFELSNAVDAGRVEASYEQGVLTVTLPKREEAKARTIPVNVR
ncbi:MAG TPA: Hsp20/alpha crystallin family protein [Anaeromyxobacter sp.]|nr:Hsp20/alpha crystallin family protein [Anaeromyxobacter sp.]